MLAVMGGAGALAASQPAAEATPSAMDAPAAATVVAPVPPVPAPARQAQRASSTRIEARFEREHDGGEDED